MGDNTFNEFAYSTIEEHLYIAKKAIDTHKSTYGDSCYGMSAFVLLSSVIDIIGTIYCNGSIRIITKEICKKNGLGSAKTHFEEYYIKFIKRLDICSKDDFINYFYHQSRCLATHNGILGLNILLTINEAPDGCFIKKDSRVTTINLRELYRLVNDSYEVLKKESGLLPPQDLFGPTTGNTINN